MQVTMVFLPPNFLLMHSHPPPPFASFPFYLLFQIPYNKLKIKNARRGIKGTTKIETGIYWHDSTDGIVMEEDVVLKVYEGKQSNE
jgi:hypothetical protein